MNKVKETRLWCDNDVSEEELLSLEKQVTINKHSGASENSSCHNIEDIDFIFDDETFDGELIQEKFTATLVSTVSSPTSATSPVFTALPKISTSYSSLSSVCSTSLTCFTSSHFALDAKMFDFDRIKKTISICPTVRVLSDPSINSNNMISIDNSTNQGISSCDKILYDGNQAIYDKDEILCSNNNRSINVKDKIVHSNENRCLNDNDVVAYDNCSNTISDMEMILCGSGIAVENIVSSDVCDKNSNIYPVSDVELTSWLIANDSSIEKSLTYDKSKLNNACLNGKLRYIFSNDEFLSCNASDNDAVEHIISDDEFQFCSTEDCDVVEHIISGSKLQTYNVYNNDIVGHVISDAELANCDTASCDANMFDVSDKELNSCDIACDEFNLSEITDEEFVNASINSFCL